MKNDGLLEWQGLLHRKDTISLSKLSEKQAQKILDDCNDGLHRGPNSLAKTT